MAEINIPTPLTDFVKLGLVKVAGEAPTANTPVIATKPEIEPAFVTPYDPDKRRQPVELVPYADRHKTTQVSSKVKQPDSDSKKLIKVVFDLVGFGEHISYYSDVVVSGNTLVLVRDLASVSSAFMPLTAASGISFTVDGDKSYIGYATGVRFTYAGNEFCVLLLDSSRG